MKIKINIKSIIFMMIISIVSLLFINISFAANTGRITTETARLRQEPKTDAKVLELASLGEEVEILEEIDDWYKVKYKNITGYIRNDLIEVKDKIQSESQQNTNNETQNTENNENTNNELQQVENTESTNNQIQNEVTQNQEVSNAEVSEENTTSENQIIEKGKYKISENLKLKIIPLISSIELYDVSAETEVEVVEILNDWVKVKTSDSKQGWVRKEKLSQIQQDTVSTEDSQNDVPESTEQTPEQTNTTTETSNQTKTMYINSQVVNLRQKADKTSEVVKKLEVNTQVTVLSNENGWYYVEVNGTKGYIAENLLSNTKQETSRSATTTRTSTAQNETKAQTDTSETKQTTSVTEENKSTTINTSSNTGSSVVEYAKQFLGCKYVYGGTTTNGFDCSGFTQYVYKHFGITLNRTASAQYSNGTSVTNLQSGDLVMFGKSGINHVGIYIGGNTFIHAANKSRGVTIDTLGSGYYKTNYVGARRIF